MVGPTFDHFFLSIQAALTGYGVAIGPKALVEDDLKAGRLIAPFPDRSLEGPGFHVLYRRQLLDDPAGEAVIEWLQQKSGVALR